MTIVDALKAKGSSGGNNIAEAIEALPSGGGGGFPVVYLVDNEDESTEEVYYSYLRDSSGNNLNEDDLYALLQSGPVLLKYGDFDPEEIGIGSSWEFIVSVYKPGSGSAATFTGFKTQYHPRDYVVYLYKIQLNVAATESGYAWTYSESTV